MDENKKFEVVLSKIPNWVSIGLLVFTLSFFGYLIWNNNNLSNRILELEQKQIHAKPFQITKFEKDSLVLELNKYQQKEDYFTTALEVQAAHYEHITNWGITISAFLLAMVGLIGVGWFWTSYDKMKQRVVNLEKNINETLKNTENSIEQIKSKLNVTLGNTYVSHAKTEEKEKRFLLAYIFYNKAALYQLKSKVEKNKSTALFNLNSALKIVLQLNPKLIEISDEEINDIEEVLNEIIYLADNKETKKITSQLYIQNSRIFNKENR